MAVVCTASRYRWVILWISLLCQIGASIASQCLPPLAPLFQEDLGLNKTQVGLFSSATFAGAWSVLLVMGSVTDRYGIRRMMSVGLLIAGTLLISMSAMSAVWMAALLMFFVGVARGAVFPGSTKAIMEWFPPSGRATAMGLKQTGGPIGGIAAAVTLPAIALVMGWRYAIGLVGFVVVAVGVATAFLYRDPERPDRKPRAQAPLLVGLKDVLGNRALWVVGISAFLFVMTQQSLISYLALYLKEVVLVPSVPDEYARIVAAGGFLAVCQMGSVFGRIFWGWVSDRLFRARRVVAMAGVGAVGTAMLLAMAEIEPGSPTSLLAGIVFTTGATVVGWNGIYHALLTEMAGSKHAATAVGLGMTMVEGGTMTGPPLFGLMVDLTGSYRWGWFLLCGLSVCGALVAMRAARMGNPPARGEGLTVDAGG